MSLESDIRFDDLSVTDIPLSPRSNMPTPRIHPQYYLKDDLSVFLVDNEVIFRVHRHLLDRESIIFRSLPTGTDENPIRLEDTCPEELVALLDHLYDSVYGDVPESTEQWTYILSISDHFQMEKVHKRAVKVLGSVQLDPVDKIVLAMDHNVPEWLDPAYIELCKREDPLREEEAEKVGLSTTVKLYLAREKIRTQLEELSASRCQRCNSAACSERHCSECCPSRPRSRSSFRTVDSPIPHPVPLPTDDADIEKVVDIGKVIADIFHPQSKQDMKLGWVNNKRKAKKNNGTGSA